MGPRVRRAGKHDIVGIERGVHAVAFHDNKGTDLTLHKSDDNQQQGKQQDNALPVDFIARSHIWSCKHETKAIRAITGPFWAY
jgi:hypothetical protein